MKILPSIHTLSLKNVIRAGRLPILIAIGIGLILFAVLPNIKAQDELGYAVDAADDNRDMLAYVSEDGHLMLYDPLNRTETTLLDGVLNFALARDGRVAFPKAENDVSDVYVFDPANPDIAPINISQNPAARNYAIAWSPDGRFLAFGAYQERDDDFYADASLYVWDGDTITDIMPKDPLDTVDNFGDINWSYDGRLTFQVGYGWANRNIPPEIYLWDGSTTINLSQNPEGWDGEASWNRDGKLMFGSDRDEAGGIYVWDGVSFIDGSPDVDSFIRVAPELQGGGYPIWIDASVVGFTVSRQSSTSVMREIVLWDLEREAIVKQSPVSSDYGSSRLAKGGQVILSSRLHSGAGTVYLDVENTEGDILFSEIVGSYAWSPDGYLAYCRLDEDRNWILSLWDSDSEETWDVARVSYRPARWKNGGNVFSCNNG